MRPSFTSTTYFLNASPSTKLLMPLCAAPTKLHFCQSCVLNIAFNHHLCEPQWLFHVFSKVMRTGLSWFLSVMTAYLQRLEGVRVSVAVQDDVVGHAEALSDSQVVEERGLAEGIRHLHHSYV